MVRPAIQYSLLAAQAQPKLNPAQAQLAGNGPGARLILAQGGAPLVAQQQGGGLTPTQQAAVDSINQRLSTAWNDPFVSYGDVQAISATLRGLSAIDQNAVVRELARTGALNSFAREMLQSAPFNLGGLTLPERNQLLADMAGKLNGANLARVAGALSAASSGVSQHELLDQFGGLVARHAGSLSKVDFIREMAARTTDQASVWSTYFGGSSRIEGDPDAMAVARVLGSLRGTRAAEGFAALNEAQLQAVIKASIRPWSVTTAMPNGAAAPPSVSYNATAFRDLMTAGASMTDPAAKARLFNAAGDALREVERANFLVAPMRGGTLDVMADGMTALLRSDPAGVIRQLALTQATWDGSDLATYAKVMLDKGRTAELGEIMAGVQFGNRGTENPVTRFDAQTILPSGQGRYDNAHALGYFVGAVYRGAQALTSDASAQNTLLTEIGKTALTAIDKGKFWGSWVGTSAALAKEWVGFMLREFNPPPGMAAAQRLEALAIPFDPQTNQQAVSSNAYSAYTASLERVRRMANP
jgi:hypothetical protein